MKQTNKFLSANLVEKMLGYLNKCLESGQLQLSYLQTIEARLLEDFQFETFSEMGYGRFLELMLKEPKLSAVSLPHIFFSCDVAVNFVSVLQSFIIHVLTNRQ